MKSRFLLVLLLATGTTGLHAQEPTPTQEQQLENEAALAEGETEDDNHWQQLDDLRRHPLNLNKATEAELSVLPMLNPLQIASFIRYRNLLGRFISIYELQAVPGWDPATIRQLLPLVTLGPVEEAVVPLGKRWNQGAHSLLVRVSQALEKVKGFQPPAAQETAHYLGSPLRVFVRYRYQFNNGLQYGLTADKDAGEPLFQKPVKAGFDFYSFHLFARKVGKIKVLALGDFTVNMGQGLIHWQSLAFKKSAAVLQVKRQGPVLKPYSAAGEYGFHRGAGVTWQHKNWETTGFASFRQLDANRVGDSVTTLQTIGYHRTAAEWQDRHSLDRLTAGATVKYSRSGWHMGANTVWYRFSLPFATSGEPYDQYAITGRQWSNHSLDYSFTYRNTHFYGEVAIDQQQKMALLQGLLMSLDPKVALSLVYRRLNKAYQSLQGNAFTENFMPSNEQGLYMGLSVKPSATWLVEGYADIFHFPWLKYRVNAPTQGADYLLQVVGKPNKQVEWLSRYRQEQKPLNYTPAGLAIHPVLPATRRNWRSQLQWQASPFIAVRSRVELVWHKVQELPVTEKGFSAFTEILYSPSRTYTFNMRLQFFETDSYNTRIYAYEQDVQYSFSIPPFSGKGFRYYLNYKQRLSGLLFRRALGKMDATLWLRWAQFLYPGKMTTGSGLNELDSKTRSDFRVQLLFQTR